MKWSCLLTVATANPGWSPSSDTCEMDIGPAGQQQGQRVTNHLNSERYYYIQTQSPLQSSPDSYHYSQIFKFTIQLIYFW